MNLLGCQNDCETFDLGFSVMSQLPAHFSSAGGLELVMSEVHFEGEWTRA